jgi:hypothetical protein
VTFRIVFLASLALLAVILWIAYSRRRLAAAIRRALSREIAIPARADPPNLYERPFPRKLGWNWAALILGPIWYFLQGLWVHGVVLASLVFLSGGLLAPLVWRYAGLKADEDLLEFRIAGKGVY